MCRSQQTWVSWCQQHSKFNKQYKLIFSNLFACFVVSVHVVPNAYWKRVCIVAIKIKMCIKLNCFTQCTVLEQKRVSVKLNKVSFLFGGVWMGYVFLQSIHWWHFILNVSYLQNKMFCFLHPWDSLLTLRHNLPCGLLTTV